jgi:hypothetical protein
MHGYRFFEPYTPCSSVPGWICSPPGGMVSGAEVLLAQPPSQQCFTAHLARFQVLPPPLSCLKMWCRSSLPPTQTNTVYQLQKNVTPCSTRITSITFPVVTTTAVHSASASHGLREDACPTKNTIALQLSLANAWAHPFL